MINPKINCRLIVLPINRGIKSTAKSTQLVQILLQIFSVNEPLKPITSRAAFRILLECKKTMLLKTSTVKLLNIRRCKISKGPLHFNCTFQLLTPCQREYFTWSAPCSQGCSGLLLSSHFQSL